MLYGTGQGSSAGKRHRRRVHALMRRHKMVERAGGRAADVVAAADASTHHRAARRADVGIAPWGIGSLNPPHGQRVEKKSHAPSRQDLRTRTAHPRLAQGSGSARGGSRPEAFLPLGDGKSSASARRSAPGRPGASLHAQPTWTALAARACSSIDARSSPTSDTCPSQPAAPEVSAPWPTSSFPTPAATSRASRRSWPRSKRRAGPSGGTRKSPPARNSTGRSPRS